MLLRVRIVPRADGKHPDRGEEVAVDMSSPIVDVEETLERLPVGVRCT